MTKVLYIGNSLTGKNKGFTPTGIDTLSKQLESIGIKVFKAGTIKNQKLRLLEMIYKTLAFRRKVDFVLIDTYSTKAFWYALINGGICRLLGMRYIAILRGGDLPSRLKRSKRLCDFLFNNSYRNVAVSGYLDFHFREAGYSSVVIPNNINVVNYAFKLRQKPQPRLLWVRSFHADYNPSMAIRVLERLLEKYDNSRLCMVGPEKDMSLTEFKRYASERNVADKIEITGRLDKPDWHKLSENYDVFINTTNYDNTPVSVMEAMALGLPVVTTNVGGIPFLLENGNDAFLVNKDDDKAMYDRIIMLIEDSDTAVKLATAARAKVEGFDWEKINEKWINLFNDGIV